MEEGGIYISQGIRPLWHRLIAASCFTIAIFLLYLFFKGVYYGNIVPSIIALFSIPVVYGVNFSLVKTYNFDIPNKRYKTIKSIGPLKWEKWVDFENLSYVAAFLNVKGYYEVNLWYNRNKHFNIANFAEIDDALHCIKELASKLQLDALDAATDSRDSKWL